MSEKLDNCVHTCGYGGVIQEGNGEAADTCWFEICTYCCKYIKYKEIKNHLNNCHPELKEIISSASTNETIDIPYFLRRSSS